MTLFVGVVDCILHLQLEIPDTRFSSPISLILRIETPVTVPLHLLRRNRPLLEFFFWCHVSDTHIGAG